MSVINSIQRRRSVRTYTGEPLTAEQINLIEQFIAFTKAPFGAKVRVQFVHSKAGEKPVKLGTYGWIRGASDFLALVCEKEALAEIAAGYYFEQIVLFCTSLGLGTCWLGGSFNRGDFKKQIKLNKDEQIRIVSPVGIASDRKRWFIEGVVLNADKKHSSRKPFGEIFFNNTFDTPLSNAAAADFAVPLEMLRLSPSASNKQEWRVVKADNVLHFYAVPYLGYETIDIGIAMCHFEQTCKELNIGGKFEELDKYPQNNNAKYVISWVKDENITNTGSVD